MFCLILKVCWVILASMKIFCEVHIMHHLSQFFSRINKLSVFCLFFCFSMAGISYGATYYMPDDFPNLQAAMAAMAGGDELIIRDGTYTGDSNIITTYAYPPHGSSGAYTIVRAEHPGNVVIDGQGARRPMHYEPGGAVNAYWQIEGIVFKNSSDQAVYLVRSSYVKFLKCGFAESNGNSDSFATHTCNYILAEECYSWGNARYHFHYYHTDHSIFRRCVARHDRGTWVYQVGFQVYDSQYVNVQNCIFIDSDQNSYYNSPEQFYAFKVPQVSRGDIIFEGNIAISSPSAAGLFIQEGDRNAVTNMFAWGMVKAIWHRGVGSLDVSHCTYGNLSGYGIKSDAASDDVNDSIFFDITGDTLFDAGTIFTNDYNSLYSNDNDYLNTSAGSHSLCAKNSNAIDPIDGTPGNSIVSIKYPTRVEDESDLDGAASDGGDIGATILKKIGVSGTLWGEPGYNTATQENLWPFPNEDIIREYMRSYSYDNCNLSGKRGFCFDGKQLNGVDDITLTSYIWEYLGNPIPPEIYGSNPPDPPTPDMTPPVLSNVGTNNITSTSATIIWSTDEQATGLVDYGETTGYGQQQTQTSLLTSHQVALSGLQPNTTYHYKVTSSDTSNNSAESSDFTFTTQGLIPPGSPRDFMVYSAE